LPTAFVNYDDEDYVTRNPHVQSGLTWQGIPLGADKHACQQLAPR